MTDNPTAFNSAGRENLTKYVVFSVEFNGIIRIFNFRQDITLKFQKN